MRGKMIPNENPQTIRRGAPMITTQDRTRRPGPPPGRRWPRRRQRISRGAIRLMLAPPSWTTWGQGLQPGGRRRLRQSRLHRRGPVRRQPAGPARAAGRRCATRTPRICRRGRWAPGWRRPGRRSWSSSGPPEEYEVIFTPNATGALRLVGESYPFGPGSRFLLTFDNHNSVNGIRQFARARGASVSYVPLTADLRDHSRRGPRPPAPGPGPPPPAGRRSGPAARSLFAYPAQSNFSGVQHPLAWIAQAQAAGYDVLLDAAAFAPASQLDLSRWHPDYVSLSFYKIFGYPTGIGALLAASRRWPGCAARGTPAAPSPSPRSAPKRPGEGSTSPGRRLQDGTVDYLGIPAVGIGLDHISRPASRPSTPG